VTVEPDNTVRIDQNLEICKRMREHYPGLKMKRFP
jgi:hypothetical protein